MQKYGLMTYNTEQYCKMGFVNLGDYVQSIAAKQFLPRVDHFIPRDYMNEYKGEAVKMIMNGWYMNNPENYPPSTDIIPLHTSIHINSSIEKKFFNDKNIEYLNSTGPVGCRDLFTYKLMQRYGVESYFSACLTLTLGKTYKRITVSENIYFIDVMYLTSLFTELLKNPLRLGKRVINGKIKDTLGKSYFFKRFFSKDLISKAQFLKQDISYVEPVEGLRLADEYLKKLCEAKLVITSRIHVALPCLAMGTPVIFVNADFQNELDNCRFEGLYDFFNRIDFDYKTGVSKTNFDLKESGDIIDLNTEIKNKDHHIAYANKLVNLCEKFINH